MDPPLLFVHSLAVHPKELFWVYSFSSSSFMGYPSVQAYLETFQSAVQGEGMYSFKNGEQLQVIEKAKLLGVHFNSNLTWDDNTSAIIKRAMSKMWLLRRMKCVNLDQHMIFDYFIKEIQPTVECDVQVWNSAIQRNRVMILRGLRK